MLLGELFVLQICMLMFHPCHDGEVLMQAVVEVVFWNLYCIALAIKVKDLVTLLAIISRQILSPGSGQTGGGEEVHTVAICTC